MNQKSNFGSLAHQGGPKGNGKNCRFSGNSLISSFKNRPAMTEQYASSRNLKFLLYEVFDALQLAQYDYFAGYDKEAFELTLDAARQIGDKYLYPSYRVMDKDKARYVDGIVKVHSSMRPAIQAIAEGGWISAAHSYEDGGQQMPFTLIS